VSITKITFSAVVVFILLLISMIFFSDLFNRSNSNDKALSIAQETVLPETGAIANNEIVSYENGGYTKRLGAYENHSGTNSEEVLVWAEKLETLNKTATTDDANYIKNEWRSSIRTGGASRKYQILSIAFVDGSVDQSVFSSLAAVFSSPYDHEEVSITCYILSRYADFDTALNLLGRFQNVNTNTEYAFAINNAISWSRYWKARNSDMNLITNPFAASGPALDVGPSSHPPLLDLDSLGLDVDQLSHELEKPIDRKYGD